MGGAHGVFAGGGGGDAGGVLEEVLELEGLLLLSRAKRASECSVGVADAVVGGGGAGVGLEVGVGFGLVVADLGV